jgi:cyclin H
MPKYQNSTHQKFWIFDSSKLLEIQLKRDADLSSFITSQTGDNSLLKYQVTPEEENSVLYLISLNLIKACKHFNMHDKAISTALTYFKRFYLNNSICRYDPAVMMFTVMFLACKTEEINVGGVETICQQFRGTDSNAILELEFILLSEIKFHLYIFSPYKPLQAFLEQIPEDLLPQTEKASRQEKTRGIIENFLISDTCLKLSPSEMALTCFYLALEGFQRKEQVMVEGFKAIGKDFDSFRGKLASAVQEFKEFQDKAAVYEGIARAAMKKAMSLRHRLKKGLRGKN